MRPLIIVLALVLFFPASCKETGGASTAGGLDVEVSAAQRAELENGPTLEQSKVVAALNDFACRVYRKLAKENEGQGIFLSPFGIHSALGMTLGGARAKTAEEMRRTLGFAEGDAGLQRGMGALTRHVLDMAQQSGVALHVANRLWARQDLKASQEYRALLKVIYGADMSIQDFAGDPAGSRDRINKWTAERTAGRIKKLVPPNMIKPDTMFMLTNAMYFKSDWQMTFKKSETKDAPFFLLGGEKRLVPTMYQKARFEYLQGGDFQLLEMPYKGEQESMLIVLPQAREGIRALEGKIGAAWLKEQRGRMSERKIKVYLPRFKMESSFELKPALSEMGMSSAFSPGEANFSGIDGSSPESGGRFFIGQVLHKSFIEVDEKGTEAAAATVVHGNLKSLGGPPPTPRFVAEHPFIFLLLDTETGAILFMGRVMDPSR